MVNLLKKASYLVTNTQVNFLENAKNITINTPNTVLTAIDTIIKLELND